MQFGIQYLVQKRDTWSAHMESADIRNIVENKVKLLSETAEELAYVCCYKTVIFSKT
jgi:hypothetical protein